MPACVQITDLEGNTQFTFGSPVTTPGSIDTLVSTAAARRHA